MGQSYSRLSLQERLIIEKLYKKNMTMADMNKIADMIGRNRTTIYREILHNTEDGKTYNAKDAQWRAKRNFKTKNISGQLARGESTRKKVYELWKKEPNLDKQEMAKRLGCSKSTVFRYLREIKSNS